MPISETLLIFTAAPLLMNISPGPFLLLGLIVTLSAIPCDLFVAWVSGSAARMVAANPRLVRIQEYVSGSILVGPGLYVAQTERAN